MKIVWDDQKRIQNLAKHGFDFAQLSPDFFDAAIVLPAKGSRFMAINVMDDDVLAVVFGRLGSEGISIISMRRASRKERTLL